MDTDVAGATRTSWRRRAPLALVAALALLVTATTAAEAQAPPPPHAPQVTATATTAQARADVGLRVDLRRVPGHAPVESAILTLPDGLLGRLLSVPFCPEADAARGTCPATARLGTAQLVVEAPGGLRTLTGSLSLAGPANGVLARMVLSLPTGAGRLVVSGAISLGERDGRLSVGLRIPQTIGGAPVVLRRLTLDVTRPGFLFNPSGCQGRAVEATVTARGGAVATAAAPYRVTGCDRLAFAPTAELFNEDRSTRRRGERPPLTVDLRPRAEDAALRDIDIGFPRHLSPNIGLLTTVCSQEALAADRCPPATRIATARATSPLIPDELRGDVHLVFPREQENSGPGVELPSIAITLEALGGLVKLRLDGRLRLSDGRLVSSFTSLPDVPLTSFTLDLREGNFIATRPLCSPGFARADVRIAGHDGSVRTSTVAPEFAACLRAPGVRVTMDRVGSDRPTITARIARPPRGARMRRLTLTLPDALAVRRTRSGVSVHVGDRTLPRRHWTLSRSGRLRITGGIGDATRVRVVLRRGAVVAGPETRRLARSGVLRLPFRVSIRDRAGKIKTRRTFGYDEAWRAPPAASERR